MEVASAGAIACTERSNSTAAATHCHKRACAYADAKPHISAKERHGTLRQREIQKKSAERTNMAKKQQSKSKLALARRSACYSRKPLSGEQQMERCDHWRDVRIRRVTERLAIHPKIERKVRD